MRIRLQFQGIVLILFGMLLALIGASLGIFYGRVLALGFCIAALIAGILGLALSLSKENGGQDS